MGKQLTGFIGLAAVMVLAIVVTLGVSTFTSTTSVQAKMAEGVEGEITPIGSIFSPLVAAATVTGVGGTNLDSTMSTTDPGAAAKYTIKFKTNGSNTSTVSLAAGSGTITLDWDSDFGIPATIATNLVTMSASSVAGGSSPVADEVVNPTDVTITFIGVENDEPRMVLTVPDMDTSDDTGGNGISELSNVTITIAQGAGITNPSEGQTPTM